MTKNEDYIRPKKISKYKKIHEHLVETGQPTLEYAMQNNMNHSTMKSGLSLYRRIAGIKVKRGRPMGVKNKSLKAENERLKLQLEECNEKLINLTQK